MEVNIHVFIKLRVHKNSPSPVTAPWPHEALRANFLAKEAIFACLKLNVNE